jgi:hypothetical protein
MRAVKPDLNQAVLVGLDNRLGFKGVCVVIRNASRRRIAALYARERSTWLDRNPGLCLGSQTGLGV